MFPAVVPGLAGVPADEPYADGWQYYRHWVFSTVNVTFGYRTLTKSGGSDTELAAKVSPAGAGRSAAQPGFPAALTVTVTNSSGTAATPLNLTKS